MNNKKPIISICIPTYNREISLKELIECIINQEGFSEDIEIMIYNDPSSDNTQSMVEWYQKKYSNIRYHRNQVRIGMIPSILDAIQMCRWEYVWLFSDDDLMAKNTIKTMIEVIKEQKPWLILNKMLWFSDKIVVKTKIENNKWTINSVIGMEELLNFLSTINYSMDWYLAHCSLFCFKKDIYIKNLEILLKEYWPTYIETLNADYLAHVKIVYLPFWNKEKIVVIAKDLVLVRWGNISWNYKFKVTQDYKNLINELHKRYKINKKTYKKMIRLHYYSIFLYVVIVHIQKYLPKKVYNSLINIWRKMIKLIKIW